jgi:hypothetical protein
MPGLPDLTTILPGGKAALRFALGSASLAAGGWVLQALRDAPAALGARRAGDTRGSDLNCCTDGAPGAVGARRVKYTRVSDLGRSRKKSMRGAAGARQCCPGQKRGRLAPPAWRPQAWQ